MKLIKKQVLDTLVFVAVFRNVFLFGNELRQYITS